MTGPASPRAVVIGGGVGGASAALHLAGAGWEVDLVERSDRLGGLVMSLEIGGTPIERFYHHVFPHEHHVIDLISQLGLGDRLEWRASTVGMLIDGRVWPFVSPTDLLRFKPLGVRDRLVTGIGGLRSLQWPGWWELEQITAGEWLTDLTGPAGFRQVWEPMLRAKFGSAAGNVPAAWMWGRFQQRAAARRLGGERLGYLRGGFRQLFDALEGELTRQGVKLHLGVAATSIAVGDGRVTAVDTDTGSLDADVVVFAGTLPALSPLVPAAHRDPRWAEIGGLGAMAVVLELRRQITDTYWVNICDADLPLTAYIEHTNFVPAADYGGVHLAYLARYFTSDDPVAAVDPEAEAWRWVDALAGRLPGFSRQDVLAVHPARTLYAAPLVQLGHLARVPPVRSHIGGLYVATTAQIYPQDRGMSEGIRLGREAADHALADQRPGVERVGVQSAGEDTGTWSCPVCGSDRYRRRWRAPSTGSESGVSADAFRPSAERFGEPSGNVVSCTKCGHGTLERYPSAEAVAGAYEDARDAVSLVEEAGQVATGRRAMDRIEAVVRPGRLVDLGCWTGSLLVAASERGWEVSGVEPSTWAAERARQRGLDVKATRIDDTQLTPGTYRAAALCDVLEHLDDPGAALEEVHRLLEPGGVLYVTVPDAGSRLARVMGRRWWAVLPMHLQYFSRSSMQHLLEDHGFRLVSQRTHAKTFSARYYAQRLGGYEPLMAGAAALVLERAGLADRLVTPNFGDRLEVVAVSR